LNNGSNEQTKNDQSSDGKIKTEILFFNPDIAREPADPMQLIMKEVNNNTCHNDDHPDHNDPFTRFIVHAIKLDMTIIRFYFDDHHFYKREVGVVLYR
jgi:hypothetical protein